MQLQGMLVHRRAKGSLTFEQKQLVLEFMKRAGSLEYTLEVLRALHDRILVEITNLEVAFGAENPAARSLIEALKV